MLHPKLWICLNGKTSVQYKYLVSCTLFLCLSEFLRTKVRPKKYQTTNKKHHLKPPGHSVKDHQPLTTKNHQRLASTLPFVGICDLGLANFRCVWLCWLSFHPTLVGCWFVRRIFLGWQCYILYTYITNVTFWFKKRLGWKSNMHVEVLPIEHKGFY